MKTFSFFKTGCSIVALIVVLWGLLGTSQVYAEGECFDFKINLSRGNKGAEVTNLQKWLIGEGHDIPSLAKGVKYGTFGIQTEHALKEYQRSRGMTKGLGFFGPVTRAKMAAECTGAEEAEPTDLTSHAVAQAVPPQGEEQETDSNVSVHITVNGQESVTVSPKAPLSFSWESVGATYCHNSSQQESWDLWRGKHLEGSVTFMAPARIGNYIYSITCGTASNLNLYATSTVSVDVI